MAKIPTEGLDFILITNRNVCGSKLADIVQQAIEGGVGTVQLREKDLNTRELYDLASDIREITNKRDVNLVINDRVDIALAVGAEGVHLGWQSLDIETVRSMIGNDKLIGFSAHSLKDAVTAMDRGADYVTISPVFKTSHKDYVTEPLGVEEICRIKERVSIPVIALGGINEDNVEDVMRNGADGIAVISAILLSGNPERSTAGLYCEMKKYGSKTESNILIGRKDAITN